MIVDSRLELCNATAVNTGGAATYLIGAQIDLGATTTYLGDGEPLYLHIISQTDIITAGSAGTIQFILASDDTASVSTTTSTIHVTSEAFVNDDTAAHDARLMAGGVLFSGPLPYGAYERFLGILQVTGTTAASAGAIDAFINKDPIPRNRAYPDAL